MNPARSLARLALAFTLLANPGFAQRLDAGRRPLRDATVEVQPLPGDLLAQQRFALDYLPLSMSDRFGSALCRAGDLDGDGNEDLIVGSAQDNTNNVNGALWILYLDAEGRERAWTHLTPSRPPVGTADRFGSALANLGDLDGDGAFELAVGAPLTTSPSFAIGKVWILSLENDGDIRSQHAITQGESGFDEFLEHSDLFGCALAALGDVDGDGVGDLAVGASNDLVGDEHSGSVRILFLNPDATVKALTTIAPGLGGFTGDADEFDQFGSALAALGDLDGDGVNDLAVGAAGGSAAGFLNPTGTVWLMFLEPDGTVREYAKVDPPEATEGFGSSLDVFDLEGDGLLELLIGAPDDHETVFDTGATFIMSVDSDGTATARSKLSHHAGGVTGIRTGDRFGAGVLSLGDIDGDGIQDVFVGSPGNENSQCRDVGVVYRLLLDSDGEAFAQHEIGGRCLRRERFGSSAAEIGDLTGDGRAEFAVGVAGPGSQNSGGAAWIYSPDSESGHALLRTLVPDTSELPVAGFASSLAGIGDINGDGTADLAVGAAESDRLYVFQLQPGGTVLRQRSFDAARLGTRYGHSLVALDDLDGDGIRELAVGAPHHDFDTGGWSNSNQAGGMVVVFLNSNGTRRTSLVITEAEGGFTGYLPAYEHFGYALAWLGDLDGDGYGELAVGAPSDNVYGPLEPGTVWILSLAPDGSVVRELQIGYGLAGFLGAIAGQDQFGAGLCNADDLDGDGLPELVVAAPGDDDGGQDFGALWVLFLQPDGTVRSWRKLSDTQGHVRARRLDGAGLGQGMALLPAFGGSDHVTLFVGAPQDDRVAGDAGFGWTVDLFRAVGPP